MISLKKINTKDYELSKVQDGLADGFKTLFKMNPILGGVFKSAAIGTGDTIVQHGLGRELVGWMIVGQNAASTIYESSSTNNFKDSQIILKASGTVTAKFYFF